MEDDRLGWKLKQPTLYIQDKEKGISKERNMGIY